MKLIYVIETVQEYASMASPVRQPEDTRPRLTGSLEVIKPENLEDPHHVELVGDPHFQFSMSFCDYVVSVSEMAGIKLMAQGSIPS